MVSPSTTSTTQTTTSPNLVECPSMKRLLKWHDVKVKNKWPTGFEMWIKFRRVEIDGPWTIVLQFDSDLDVAVEFFTWQATLQVSADHRIVTMNSMPWNEKLSADSTYRILLVVSGERLENLPRYTVSWTRGKYQDLSCLLDEAISTKPPTTTTRPQIEDNNFCVGKPDGLYAHPDCTKYYHCYSGGYQAVQPCPEGLYFNPKLSYCDYPQNVPECFGLPTSTLPPISTTNVSSLITSTSTTTTKTTQVTKTKPEDPNFCMNNGKSDGYFAHPDCQKFYQCYHNGASTAIKTCGPGTLWSQNLLTCDHAYNIECKHD